MLVGQSIDGTAEVHDIYRYNKASQSTHDRGIAAVQLLHQNKANFNARVWLGA